MISNSGHDENGKYRGGTAGDQTGGEWQLQAWYNRPWNVILHHADAKVRAEIAALAISAAQNNHIGYDKDQRTTFWKQLKKCGYDPAKITVNCEADCSAGVAAIVKAVGYRLNIDKLKNVSEDAYTGNLKDILKKAGFSALTAEKYRTSDKYLYAGDILLYEGHHTAINVTDGKNVTPETVKKGVSGTATLLLQETLNMLGYTDDSGKKLAEDGSCGAFTVQAIKKFQKANGLDVDGSCGPKTWAAVNKAIADYKPAKRVKILTYLNCRKGVGVKNDVIKILKEGDVFTVGKEQDGWLYLNEVGGWVNGIYVKEV